MVNDKDELWVFGYGSLMWNPGFEHLEHFPAVLDGYHRCLCIYSHHYRGTPEKPGLVLGLDARAGESCIGMAFKADPAKRDMVLRYLDDREILSNVYTRERLPVRISNGAGEGTEVLAYTYVARKDSDQYTGQLDEVEILRLLRQGVGPRGTSINYLSNTVQHLDALGIKDGPLHQLLVKVQAG